MGRPSRGETTRVLNRIEHLRQQQGISRGELADKLGVHYQTMGYLERGEYNPSLELALKICRVFECSVEEVFWLDRSQGAEAELPDASRTGRR